MIYHAADVTSRHGDKTLTQNPNSDSNAKGKTVSTWVPIREKATVSRSCCELAGKGTLVAGVAGADLCGPSVPTPLNGAAERLQIAVGCDGKGGGWVEWERPESPCPSHGNSHWRDMEWMPSYGQCTVLSFHGWLPLRRFVTFYTLSFHVNQACSLPCS